MPVAALFVRKNSIYSTLPGVVECWDIERDARLYQGPWPVIAHPPCERWSRLTSIHGRVGDDAGCFEAALAAVRLFGGVLEHPFGSLAWKRFALPCIGSSDIFGRTICVKQSDFGHRAPKATLLYLVGVGALPPIPLILGDAPRSVELLGKAERERTPPLFATWLVQVAGTVGFT